MFHEGMYYICGLWYKLLPLGVIAFYHGLLAFTLPKYNIPIIGS